MLERIFRLREQGTDVRTELLAGLTTFLTMSYIIFVQPAVLSGQLVGVDTGMDFGAVTVATCLAAALATGIMALYAGYPVAQAPGMGQNFFFVFSILPAAAAIGHPEPWRAALGVIFVSGVLFLALSVVGVRRHLIDALSPSMKSGLAAGIGLFIAFIGLQNTRLVLPDPATGVTLNADFRSPDLLVFFIGLLVTAVLQARRVRGALLWGMATALAATLAFRGALAWLPGLAATESVAGSMLVQQFHPASAVVSAPPSLAPTFFRMDVGAALSLALLPMVVLVLFMDLFDTIGTLVAVTQAAGLLRDGKLPRADKALLSDAAGTVGGACLGTSTVTSYVESAAGVEAGGRTGLTGVTVAGLFLAAPLFSPVVEMVGSYPPITAPALVIVGSLMIREVVRIEWDDATEGLPAFLVLAGIPMTYSIADGLALGMISYPLVKMASGRGDEAGWLMRGLALLLLAYFVLLRSGMA